MNSTCTLKDPEIKFPCLMIHEKGNFVVLFNSYLGGTVVYDVEYPQQLGNTFRQLDIKHFRLFNGSITLSN